MTVPEPPIISGSPGITLRYQQWNNAVASTRFPAYIYDATSYQYGGNLNAYRRTWSGYNLGSIEAYGSKYTEYRDIRSTYMIKNASYTEAPATNIWKTADAYTFLSNTYNSTNQEGRLTLNTIQGEITPDINSVYILWAQLLINPIPSLPAVFTNAFMQILANGVVVADVNQNINLIAGQSLRLRNQTFVAYKNVPYTVQYKFLYTGTPPDYYISFGYTELIGQKSGCGAYTIL